MLEWHRCKYMSDSAGFLNGLSARTLDLEDIFETDYVGIAFGGSTSIKKVLPVLAPDLDYGGMQVANGTDAMEAWLRMLDLPSGEDVRKFREDMLACCKLDTFAMVRIFGRIERMI